MTAYNKLLVGYGMLEMIDTLKAPLPKYTYDVSEAYSMIPASPNPDAVGQEICSNHKLLFNPE